MTISDATNMRELINVLNEAVTIVRQTDKNGTVKKVIAYLTRQHSKQFIELAKNLIAIEQREAELKELKEGVKEDDRERLASLFEAGDNVHTRVIETATFIFNLSKDPVGSKTVKYTEVIKDLREKLTPELILILDNLIKVHETTQIPRPPKLTITSKVPIGKLPEPDYNVSDEINESRYSDPYASLLQKTKNWAIAYDKLLTALKQDIQ